MFSLITSKLLYQLVKAFNRWSDPESIQSFIWTLYNNFFEMYWTPWKYFFSRMYAGDVLGGDMWYLCGRPLATMSVDVLDGKLNRWTSLPKLEHWHMYLRPKNLKTWWLQWSVILLVYQRRLFYLTTVVHYLPNGTP